MNWNIVKPAAIITPAFMGGQVIEANGFATWWTLLYIGLILLSFELLDHWYTLKT